MFFDLDCARIFRQLSQNKTVLSISFEALAISKNEMEAAAEEIKEAYFMRRMQNWGMQVVRASESSNKIELDALMAQPPRLGRGSDIYNASQLMAHMLLEQMSGSTGHTFQSPRLKALDLKLNPNSITVVAGRSAAGKSALAEQMMLDLSAQGAYCLDVTVEVDGRYRAQRYLQHLGGPELAPDKFTDGTFNPLAMANAMEEYVRPKDISGNETPREMHVTESCFTLKDIQDTLYTYMADYELYVHARKAAGLSHPGPPVVLIDYIQLIKVKSDGIYDKMNQIIEEIYNWTKTFGLATIVVSQLKRNVGVDPKTGEYVPDMTHLEGSGRIEQLAHNILFVYAPQAAYTKGNWRKVVCAMPKRRGAEPGQMEGLYNGPWLSFTLDPSEISSITVL